ncbi:GNAT family N-acetyltransferase [Sporosarcina sp. FSL K6-6792]|uniref:GNAT family N-acetyltransferase n=1 Tax=Sporosarcina sp. FSL K6-6792 TaxID=2921559 RepID=UPI004046E136
MNTAEFNCMNLLSNIELTYHYNEKYSGKGFARETAHSYIKIARNHVEVYVVTGSGSPDSQRSLKVLEKVGFTFLGMK